MNYPEKITSFIKKKIEKSNKLDKKILKKQFYFSKQELIDNNLFIEDPLSEEENKVTEHVIHKYINKVLFLISDECFVHCRFCTRKRIIKFEKEKKKKDFMADVKYIRKNKSINEVIFSGGDPLTLSNNKWQELLNEIYNIPHIKFIRVHSRAVTVMPKRIHSWMKIMKLSIKNHPQVFHSFVLHINHFVELDKESKLIIQKLQKIGFQLYSQTVLLKGINDNASILADLFILLKKNNIQPYYIHQLDRSQGSSHFEVSIEKGRKIMKKVRKKIPPLIMPRYVVDSENGKDNLYY